jgi:hypothetical protein
MMAETHPRAIPVRVTVKTLRQMCIERDPDFIEDGENPIEYEFTRRKFRGRYRLRGPYEDS